MEIVNTIGRRKTSVARVYLTQGKGTITVNRKDAKDYFKSNVLQIIINQAFQAAEVNEMYDVKANVDGGGTNGQAQALRMAIARALCEVNPELRGRLKKEGFLTRDSRMVERKKFGRKKARRRFQFSKR
ncbi:MAG: 30S ribosomal protein S9 [Verrucomicrobia bacterium]|nr:30S ribosomal protein S9 [Cytophagales bacterium]